MDFLRANSLAEAHFYLMVTPCPSCRRGPWEVTEDLPSPGQEARILATCRNCQARKEFVFRCPPPASGGPSGPSGLATVDRVNPEPDPSRIIDVGQWIGLFHHLVETAHGSPDKVQTRRLTFQAAQCLDEALKFYQGDEELPPASSLFTEVSRRAFTEHPEKFARQRIRDLRSRLPALRRMVRRLARDQGSPRLPKWWQFWHR